jgi:hypothetical protein
MKKNMKSCIARIGIFVAIVFLLVFTPAVTANSILDHQTLFQEKLLIIAVSLMFFFIIYHKIRSRVSCAFFNRRGR